MPDELPDQLYDEILDEVEDLHWMPHPERAQLFEERAHALAPGAPGRAAWLSHAGEAWELAEDLDRARACYEAAVADGGDAYLDPRAELLGVVLRLGEKDRAEELLTQLREAVRDGHHGRFLHESVGEALELNGRLEEALRWFSAGLTLSERDTPDDPDIGCLNGRYRVRRALGLPMDRYDELSEERRRDYTDDAEEQRLLAAPDEGSVPLSVLYWPTGELESLLDRWPGLAGDYGKDHDEHRARVEQRLRHLAEAHSWLAVGDGTVEELVAFATERHQAPEHHMTRGLYGAQLAFTGRTTPWPPGRNDRCWCGSGLKYKKCCGALRFDPTVVPD